MENKSRLVSLAQSSLSSTKEKLEGISTFMDGPGKLIVEGGKFGVVGVIKILMTIVLFGGANLMLLLYAGYRGAVADSNSMNILYGGVVLIIGIIMTIVAGVKMYNFVRVDAIRLAYEKIRPYLPELFVKLVNQVADQKVDPNNPNIQQALGIASFFNSAFMKLPSIVRRFLVRRIERLPFAQFFRELHAELVKGNRQAVADTIYQRTDTYLTEFFSDNTLRWILWLLPLNIVVQFLIALQIV